MCTSSSLSYPLGYSLVDMVVVLAQRHLLHIQMGLVLALRRGSHLHVVAHLAGIPVGGRQDTGLGRILHRMHILPTPGR